MKIDEHKIEAVADTMRQVREFETMMRLATNEPARKRVKAIRDQLRGDLVDAIRALNDQETAEFMKRHC